MLPSMLVVAVLSGAAGGPEELPPLVLEVANPRQSGRRLLHTQDLIGPSARTVGAAKSVRALLLVALDGRGRVPGVPPDVLARVAKEIADKRGALVGVVLGGIERDSAFDPERSAFLITSDPHGLARRRLKWVGPGEAIVVRSDGRVVGWYDALGANLDRAKGTILDLLEEES
jgi:hypothetical protein